MLDFDQFDKHYTVRQEYWHGVWRIQCKTPANFRRVQASAVIFLFSLLDAAMPLYDEAKICRCLKRIGGSTRLLT
jgi:hypothetical protein